MRQRAPRANPVKAKAAILDAIAAGATVREACKAARCDEASFYRWQKEDSEFRESVVRARESFAAGIDEDIRAAANQRILELLQKGETETWSTKTKISEHGNVTREIEERKTVKRGTPKWVFDKLMPDSLIEQLKEVQNVNVHLHQGTEE